MAQKCPKCGTPLTSFDDRSCPNCWERLDNYTLEELEADERALNLSGVPTLVTDVRKPTDYDEGRVRFVALMFYLLGALNAVAGILIFMPGFELAGVGLIGIVLAVIHWIVAFSLNRFRVWAWHAAVVLSILSTVSVVLGSNLTCGIVGIAFYGYALVHLFQAKYLFQRRDVT